MAASSRDADGTTEAFVRKPRRGSSGRPRSTAGIEIAGDDEEAVEISGSYPENAGSCAFGGDTVTIDSPRCRNLKEKRGRGNGAAAATAKSKLRDRRRIREKRRTPGVGFAPSTEGTSSDEEDEDEGKEGEIHKLPPDSGHQHFHHHHQHHGCCAMKEQNGHEMLKKRLSPGLALRFRGSKSQSDLDADCEDNTADYDSTSVISASDAAAASSQFFVPGPPTDPGSEAEKQFQEHVAEIRVAGLAGLRKDAEDTDDDVTPSPQQQAMEKERRERAVLLQQLDHQSERISELQRIVHDLTNRLESVYVENQKLKAENKSLLETRSKTAPS